MAKGLTRAAIVNAALRLLDKVGMEGMTVRALAAELGVKAPALYWHVRDKAELLDEMATQVWREIVDELAGAPADAAWDVGLRRFAEVLRAALLRHRDGAKAFSGTYLTDADVLASQEEGMRSWAAQGFTVADTVRAFTLTSSFVVGFCIEEQAVLQADGRQQYDPKARAERVGAAEHPLVAEAGESLFGDRDAQFASLVDVIVEAVGRFRAKGAGGPQR
ncbi:TetR/AcrR family transcriptional regulator C-terminal domain-containing protein [Humibacter ginsengiterrae]